MDHYNVKVSPYVLNPIRCFKYLKFGHGKGKLKWFKCSDEDHEGFDCNNHPKCSNCGQTHIASSKNCHYFLKEKEIKKKLNQKKIYHTLRRADSSLPRMIHLCKNHMPVSLSLFSIQLKRKQCLPGLRTRKNQLGWLKEKISTPSHKTSSSSQSLYFS